jgi:hypothetical protein
VLYADNGDPVFVISDGRQWAVNTPTAQSILHAIQDGGEEEGDDDDDDDDDEMQTLFPLDNPVQAKEDARQADVIEQHHIKQQQSTSSSSVISVSTLGKIVNVGVIIFAIILYTGVGWGMVLAGPRTLRAYVCSPAIVGGSDNSGESLDLVNVDHGCLCPGTENDGMWVNLNRTMRMHTAETFKEVPFKGAAVVSSKQISSGEFAPVIDALVANLAQGHARHRFTCMHHLKQPTALTPLYRVCAMKRSRGGQITVMFNPELKGYSNKTKVILEHSLVCHGEVSAKARRTVIDIGYTTLNGVHMRSLVDDEGEAIAFQMSWNELRGEYICNA